MSATHSDANLSPGEARPTLGSSVGAIIAGWYRATRSTSGPQRVRALLFFEQPPREFCWEQDVLYRVFVGEEKHPATPAEWEFLCRAVANGFLLVFLTEGEGRAVTVLHQLGTKVPVQIHRPEELPQLLQEHELPSGSAAAPSDAEPGRTGELAGADPLPPSPPLSAPELRNSGAWDRNSSQGRSPAPPAWRLLATFVLGSEGALLLALVLLFARNLWCCLGTLGLLLAQILILRRALQARTRVEAERTPGTRC